MNYSLSPRKHYLQVADDERDREPNSDLSYTGL